MMSLGTEVFLRPDGPSDEPLHRGTIRDLDGGVCTVGMAGQGLRLRTGQQVLVHYDPDGEFTRQAAFVVAVEGSVVQLRLHGLAVSAERRRVRRVSYLDVLRQVVEEGGTVERSSAVVGRRTTAELRSTVPPS